MNIDSILALTCDISRVVNLPGNKSISQGSGKYREIPGNRKVMANGHIIMGGKYYGLVLEPKLITFSDSGVIVY